MLLSDHAEVGLLFLSVLCPLLCIDEERVVLGYSKGVLGWVPSTHLDLLRHVGFSGLVFVLLSVWSNYLLALVGPVCANILTSLVHELDVNLAVGLVLDVDNVNVCIIASRQDHTRVRRDLQVELVKDVLALVHLTELLFEIIRYVEDLARLPLVPNIPDLDRQVVPGVHVAVVDW